MQNNCPLCNQECYHTIKTVNEKEEVKEFNMGRWFFCRCGAVWNNEEYKPKEVFTKDYTRSYIEPKHNKERYEYAINTYMPLIEEITYGRKALDVGYGVDWDILKLRERGWLTTGIDLIPNDKYHTGDFTEFDFKGERFDLVKMTSVVSLFPDLGQAIKTAYDLLYPSGVLWLDFPDTDLIKAGGFASWGHWNSKEHRVHINESILRDILTKCDDLSGRMDINVIHRNMSKRFTSWNICTVIAQKVKREEL